MSWDVIARALFVDNGAAAGLAKFNNQIHEVTKAAPGGTRAFGLMERGLQTLAFEAAGATGSLGKVAEGLLKFGGGTGLVLGTAAAIGVVAGAWRIFTSETREAEKAQKDLIEQLDRLGPHAQAVAGKIKVAGLERRRDAPTTTESIGDVFSDLFSDMTGGGGRTGRREELNRQIATSTNALAAAEKNVADAGNKAVATAQRNADVMQATVAIRERAIATGQDEARTLEQIAAATAEVQAAAQHLDATQTTALVTQSVRAARLAQENRTLEAQRDLLQQIADISREVETFGAGLDLSGLRTPDILGEEAQRQASLQVGEIEKQGGQFAFEHFDQEFFDGVQGAVTEAMSSTPKPGEGGKVDVGAIAAASIAALGAMKQGGAAGILGGLGGVASELGGVKSLASTFNPIGIALNVASGFFGLFSHDQDRRHREAMEELRRIRENTGKRDQPGQMSAYIVLDGKEIALAMVPQVIYGIRRAERTKAQPVLPP